MTSRLTPLGFFVKWVVVPMIVAAIGYLLVGPRLVQTQAQPTPRTNADVPEGS